MKIYTKTGDKGTTALYGGTRVSKDHIRIDAYGTVDELNSWLGLIRDQIDLKEDLNTLLTLQKDLFYAGAELSLDPQKKVLANGTNRLKDIIEESQILFLESKIDSYQESLAPLTHFILPGGNQLVSQIHIARTICRKTERIIVALSNEEEIRPELIHYFNRLSDFLFTFARKISKDSNSEEILWLP